MEKDLAEVFRLGTAKAEENLAFRRYVSAHHLGEKKFQILASEVQRRVDCTTCGNCCRHSVVEVGQAEVEEIAAHLGTTAEEVVRLYSEADPESSKKRILRSGPGGCVFLDGNLCVIYEARPKACHEFPHVALGHRSLGARPASMARWAAYCPIIYNAIEEYKHVTGWSKVSE